MSRPTIYALILIALLAVILIFNGGKTDLNLIVSEINILKPMVYLGFTAVGVLIGVLLK